MSSVSGHTAAAERPERSRNAKAQARHRAKRKAYIEQLEQTVTKLQTALGFSPEQVAALPPPLVKIRELEQENARLTKENDELHRALVDAGINPVTGVRSLSIDSLGRRGSPLGGYSDPRDREFKRRKMDGGMDDYLPPSSHHHHSDLTRPPPLTIPQSAHSQQPHQHYSANQHNSSSSSSTSTSLFLPPPNAPPLNNTPFGQIPNTPSGSSSTSSPPYASSGSSQGYVSVKAEDDNYIFTEPTYKSSSHSPHSQSQQQQQQQHPNHGGQQQHSHYTLPPFSQTIPDHASWHTSYSSERAPLHR
ncbi:hypothetical protein C8F01DRAFT_1169609 [Mycena amicta]|nr:hypothetical protein C8F01DRAFT_1169609 [Mycena amicta]